MFWALKKWEMYITAQGPRLRNDQHCVEWDVKLYRTICAQDEIKDLIDTKLSFNYSIGNAEL